MGLKQSFLTLLLLTVVFCTIQYTFYKTFAPNSFAKSIYKKAEREKNSFYIMNNVHLTDAISLKLGSPLTSETTTVSTIPASRMPTTTNRMSTTTTTAAAAAAAAAAASTTTSGVITTTKATTSMPTTTTTRMPTSIRMPTTTTTTATATTTTTGAKPPPPTTGMLTTIRMPTTTTTTAPAATTTGAKPPPPTIGMLTTKTKMPTATTATTTTSMPTTITPGMPTTTLPITTTTATTTTTTTTSLSSSTSTTVSEIVDYPLYVDSKYHGRLGNQMFMYASMVGIALIQNRTPVISASQEKLPQSFQLTHVHEVNMSGSVGQGEKKYGTFEPDFFHLLERKNVTLSGYRVSWKYFENYTDHIRKEFTFKVNIQQEAKKVLKDVVKNRNFTALVGIHVRRGDFIQPHNVKFGYTTAPRAYFESAMRLIKSMHAKERFLFLVASNGAEWCRENIKGDDVIILPEASDVMHMAILGQCDHVIMTTGTYGWWSAFLAGGDVIYYRDFPARGSPLEEGYTSADWYYPQWIGLG